MRILSYCFTAPWFLFISDLQILKLNQHIKCSPQPPKDKTSKKSGEAKSAQLPPPTPSHGDNAPQEQKAEPEVKQDDKFTKEYKKLTESGSWYVKQKWEYVMDQPDLYDKTKESGHSPSSHIVFKVSGGNGDEKSKGKNEPSKLVIKPSSTKNGEAIYCITSMRTVVKGEKSSNYVDNPIASPLFNFVQDSSNNDLFLNQRYPASFLKKLSDLLCRFANVRYISTKLEKNAWYLTPSANATDVILKILSGQELATEAANLSGEMLKFESNALVSQEGYHYLKLSTPEKSAMHSDSPKNPAQEDSKKSIPTTSEKMSKGEEINSLCKMRNPLPSACGFTQNQQVTLANVFFILFSYSVPHVEISIETLIKKFNLPKSGSFFIECNITSFPSLNLTRTVQSCEFAMVGDGTQIAPIDNRSFFSTTIGTAILISLFFISLLFTMIFIDTNKQTATTAAKNPGTVEGSKPVEV